MIDVRESFWTVPETEWSRLTVRVRWHDFSTEVLESTGDTECFDLADLASRPVDALVGHRSVALHGGAGCTGNSAVSPLLLDLDLDGDTQGALDVLLDRVKSDLGRRDWSYRVYRSGVGYHVEVDPITIEPYAWCLDRVWARQLRDQVRDSVDGRCAPDGGKACIDVPHDMMRMVGSAHQAGGVKELVGA